MRDLGRVFLLLPLFALLAGCPEDHVSVTIVPKADGTFVRTLRFWRADSEHPDRIQPPPKERIAAAERIYGKPRSNKDGSVTFEKTLSQVPADLASAPDANAGGYVVWSSKLGTVGIYRERAPGATDYAGRFHRLEAAIDRESRVLAEMMREQLAKEKGLDRLVSYVEKTLPGDAKDAYFLLISGPESEDLSDEPMDKLDRTDSRSRLTLVLELMAERGYLPLQDLPRLFARDQDPLPALIAKKMGRPLDAELRERLAFLSDQEKAQKAFFKAAASLKVDEKTVQEDLLLFQSTVPLQFLEDARLRVDYDLKLPDGANLFATSGKPAKGSVRLPLKVDPKMLAQAVFFAAWSAPDAAWQKAHLGGVLLRGKELSSYVAWRNGLTEKQGKAWDEALNTLSPGPDLARRIRALSVDKQAWAHVGVGKLLKATAGGD